jgi:hypothetical protein
MSSIGKFFAACIAAFCLCEAGAGCTSEMDQKSNTTDSDVDGDADGDADGDTDTDSDTDADCPVPVDADPGIPLGCEGPIQFENAAFESVVRSAINKPSCDIYYSDVKDLRRIALSAS